jgi:hypothetical protein
VYSKKASPLKHFTSLLLAAKVRQIGRCSKAIFQAFFRVGEQAFFSPYLSQRRKDLMKSPRRSTAPVPYSSPKDVDSTRPSALPLNPKIARGKGLNIDQLTSVPRSAESWNDQTESNHLDSVFAVSSAPVENGPSHTVGHIDCPACQAFDELVKADLLGMANQTFEDAAVVWQGVRRNSNALRERTHEAVDEYVVALTKFFEGIVMRSVNPGMLKAYQTARKTNSLAIAGKVQRPWQRCASHTRINHELNVLAQMLRACNEWEKIRPYYFPLSVPKWSPREILSEKQEEDPFKNGAGYPEAELAYCVAAITNNITASGVELRCLKIENLFLRPAGEISEIYIPPEACKNDHRPRKIALNDVALWAVRKVYQREILASVSESPVTLPQTPVFGSVSELAIWRSSRVYLVGFVITLARTRETAARKIED